MIKNAMIGWCKPKINLWNPLNLIKYFIKRNDTIHYVHIIFNNDQSIKIPTRSYDDAVELLVKIRNLKL